MGFEVDLLQRRAVVLTLHLLAFLQGRGLPGSVEAHLMGVFQLVEVTVLVVALAAIVAWVDRLWCERREGTVPWLLLGVHAAAGLYALRLLYWVYLHPSRELAVVAARWDYLVSVILGGLVLRRAPLQARIWCFVVVSLLLVDQYIGRTPFQIVMLGCLVGFAATRWEVTNRPGVRVVVQGAVMAAVFGWLWWSRASNPLGALQGWGLYSFVLFRHVSFVVEQARGLPGTLGGYLCYLLFFPNCVGAMEVYDEFHERNLRGDAARQFGRAALKVVAGKALIWFGAVIPMDESQMVASVGFASMWSNVAVLFLRAACGVMGIWSVIEGGALFLGVQLRPNFRGVLTATNPSQFWRAWRGTMTNWLIRYIYIPLGGNRRHQAANIFAAFLVSTVWHCLGAPFLRPQTWNVYELVPIVTWGAVNFAGVAAHARARRRWPPVEPRGRLRRALRVLKWPLAMVFGSMTVVLLGFGIGRIELFGHVVRTLLGLEGW